MREGSNRQPGYGALQDPHPTPSVFTVHVGAVLGPEWTDWFDGAEIIDRGDGSGLIIAAVSDQAMLFGLLLRIRDLRIPLLGLYPGGEARIGANARGSDGNIQNWRRS